MNINTFCHNFTSNISQSKLLDMNKLCCINVYSVLSPFVYIFNEGFQTSFEKLEDNFVDIMSRSKYKTMTFVDYIYSMKNFNYLLVYILLVICGIVVLIFIVMPALYTSKVCCIRSLNGLRYQTMFNVELLILLITVGILIVVNTTYCMLTIQLNELLLKIPHIIRNFVQLHENFIAELKDQMQCVFDHIKNQEDIIISDLRLMPNMITIITNNFFLVRLKEFIEIFNNITISSVHSTLASHGNGTWPVEHFQQHMIVKNRTLTPLLLADATTYDSGNIDDKQLAILYGSILNNSLGTLFKGNEVTVEHVVNKIKNTTNYNNMMQSLIYYFRSTGRSWKIMNDSSCTFFDRLFSKQVKIYVQTLDTQLQKFIDFPYLIKTENIYGRFFTWILFLPSAHSIVYILLLIPGLLIALWGVQKTSISRKLPLILPNTKWLLISIYFGVLFLWYSLLLSGGLYLAYIIITTLCKSIEDERIITEYMDNFFKKSLKEFRNLENGTVSIIDIMTRCKKNESLFEGFYKWNSTNSRTLWKIFYEFGNFIGQEIQKYYDDFTIHTDLRNSLNLEILPNGYRNISETFKKSFPLNSQISFEIRDALYKKFNRILESREQLQYSIPKTLKNIGKCWPLNLIYAEIECLLCRCLLPFMAEIWFSIATLVVAMSLSLIFACRMVAYAKGTFEKYREIKDVASRRYSSKTAKFHIKYPDGNKE